MSACCYWISKLLCVRSFYELMSKPERKPFEPPDICLMDVRFTKEKECSKSTLVWYFLVCILGTARLKEKGTKKYRGRKKKTETRTL